MQRMMKKMKSKGGMIEDDARDESGMMPPGFRAVNTRIKRRCNGCTQFTLVTYSVYASAHLLTLPRDSGYIGLTFWASAAGCSNRCTRFSPTTRDYLAYWL